MSTRRKGKETGIALPYVVSLDKATSTVLAIRRNWYEGDELHLKRQHFVHYQYIPGFGFYGYGLIHLIGGYAKSATMLIRQLVDAGTLSNLPGGLKSRGLRIKGDDTPIQPGEFRDVDVPSGSIRDNILPLPYKEPSQVLFALFQNIVEEGRSFASSGDMNVSDMSAQAPVGTTLALLERQLKVMGAVQARIHFTMKQEFKLLKVIIADYTPDEYEYEPVDGDRKAKKSDYDMVDVIPVSDPNAATMAQKIVQYQAVMQLAQQAPQLYDLSLLHRQMIEVLGVKNADKLVKTKDDEVPTDPVQENQDLLTMKPVKAFIEQNHQAHIQVHMAAIQDPKIQQMMQMNPQAQVIMASAMAHINEHMAWSIANKLRRVLACRCPVKKITRRSLLNRRIRLLLCQRKRLNRFFSRTNKKPSKSRLNNRCKIQLFKCRCKSCKSNKASCSLNSRSNRLMQQPKADQIRIEESRIEAQKEIAAMQVGAQSAAKRR
jgi:hypothetical protein